MPSSPPRPIRVIGAGPAGSASAISALSAGAAVELIEKSNVPRHKVCGEFLSPEVGPQLEELGVWPQFLDARPARLARMILHFGRHVSRSRLPERAFGLSRYQLDGLLLKKAISLGAAPRPELAPGDPQNSVLACGRYSIAAPGERLFGFKAHFMGPVDDAIEMFFSGGFYVGVGAVEDGITNVCGMAPDRMLRRHDFDIDELLLGCEALKDRLRPLERIRRWLISGPMVLGPQWKRPLAPDAYPAAVYPAGDALGFVDPFTGTGILNALTTGRMAGLAAAQGVAAEKYMAECRGRLNRHFMVSELFRRAVDREWLGALAAAIPGEWLFKLTRPPRQYY